jgi:hypothetical protein
MWLVTVSAHGRDSANGINADVMLRRSNLGGVIRSHGFGPGSVDLELVVSAPTEARACETVRNRVTDILGPDWTIDIRSGAVLAEPTTH